MNIMNIIISKYKEDVSWTSRFKKSSIIIYDKSGEKSPYISLPNIGRESHTYLTYIIDNYDNLSEYTCFLQGNPFDHLVYTIEHIDDMNLDNIDFFSLCKEFSCNLNGAPDHPNLNIKELIFDKYFIINIDTIKFAVGAQFIVSRKAILNRSKRFYELLLKEFLRTDIEDLYYNDNKMPWVLERVWYYIFNTKIKSKYDV